MVSGYHQLAGCSSLKPGGEVARTEDIGQTTLKLRSLEVHVGRESKSILRGGCKAFGFEIGLVTELHEGGHRVLYSEGGGYTSGFMLPEDSGLLGLLREEPSALIEPSDGPPGSPRAYVGRAIKVDDEVVGSLCFFSLQPRAEPFRNDVELLVELMANSISSLRERLRVEEHLRRSEQRFRRFFLLSAVGMAMVQADRKWGTVNDKLVDMLGYTRATLESMSWDAVTHPDDLRTELERWAETLRGERMGYVLEKRFLRSDGTTVYASVATRCLWTRDGSVDSVIVLVQDVTRRHRAENEGKRLEGQLVDGQKLESLGSLAGGIAHDFNNLLTGVIGNAHLAKAELSHDHNAQRPLDSVLRAAERATKLTGQLLAYSGKGAFVVRPLDLTECVNDLASLLDTLVPKKVELRLDLGIQLPTMKADEAQIQQIVVNLVVNAGEAIEGIGTVHVRTGTSFMQETRDEEFVLSGGLGPGPCVYLEVSDTGSGVAEDELRKIFDPFFTTKFTGRGLGLAAVLGIVRGHDGAISVKTTPGEGSVFRVYFSTHSASSKHRLQRIQQDQEGSLILVVDDEELVRSACCQSLRSLGYSVLPASGGREALDLFKQDPARIAAVILDMTMPDLDGVETFKLMREVRADVPVILTSGYSERDALARLDGTPADFLPKPYAPKVLGEKLRSVMSPA